MKEYHSIAEEDFRAETKNADRLRTLAELHPTEIAFFKKRFVWSGNNGGCYVRYRYERLLRPCEKPIPKWIALKSRGGWQHLYTELVDSLVEKHLNFEKFYKTSRIGPSCDRLEPNADETAFWFGTMAGLSTYNDCIDIDSHDQIGWNPIPTMWHFSRTGSVNGPYSWRFVPVVKPSLRFFQIAKTIYDTFPNRIWAFSSANFGLAIWKVYDQSELTHVVCRKVEAKLRAAGLTVEHYPLPAKTGLGKCHRRPCGMDSAIITDAGPITDPIQQIRAYMSPPRTPTFQTILQACFDGLIRSYDLFLKEGEGIDHKRIHPDDKKFLVDSCLEVVEEVINWAEAGYPIDRDLLSAQEPETSESPSSEHDDVDDQTHEISDTNFLEVPSDKYPTYFWNVDLHKIAQSGQWVQFIRFLVENGIPTEDKFSEVISALALWFGFVELFNEDRDRIKHVLRTFALTRHNGKVSRLLAGESGEVVSHVDRIADGVLNGEDAQGKSVFAELRQKRITGQYKQPFSFEPQILRENRDCSSLQQHILPQSYLICRGLIPDSQPDEASAEWSYQPDDTPLPDEVMNRIRTAFREAGRQIRRNKTGKYAILDSITRFFNYLFCGRKSGSRRASRELLEKMGLPEKTSELKAIISPLEQEGLLHKGGYSRGLVSREWHLDRSVIRSMHERNTVTKTA